MAKGKKDKSKRKVPPWGRKESAVQQDVGLNYSHDVPLGNTDPTVVQGVMYGGMPNKSRKATGGLKKQKGKYT